MVTGSTITAVPCAGSLTSVAVAPCGAPGTSAILIVIDPFAGVAALLAVDDALADGFAEEETDAVGEALAVTVAVGEAEADGVAVTVAVAVAVAVAVGVAVGVGEASDEPRSAAIHN